MKNKSLKRQLANSFRQRIHDKASSVNIPKLGEPESEPIGAESLIEDLLRWADDGGQMLNLRNSQYPSNSDIAGERMMKSRRLGSQEGAVR
jgi:hypothetical protein